jgi:catechol 2,3-dioxygenase-like lactoylglutathione lyase family enzyme
MMLSHVYIGVSDFERAFAFYAPLMEGLGLTLKFRELRDSDQSWAGWMTPGVLRPLFLLGKPYDSKPHASGNGQMVALLAPTRAAVDHAYAHALAHGGVCEGPPGLRPEYHAHYYGAYFRDPDGNKLCVCCHDPA